jgi:hypothetical protein
MAGLEKHAERSARYTSIAEMRSPSGLFEPEG